jgi:hypothetical protein
MTVLYDPILDFTRAHSLAGAKEEGDAQGLRRLVVTMWRKRQINVIYTR